MHNNLRIYNKLLRQVSKWHPNERITRRRNMALMIVGLFLGMTIHLSGIVSRWPLEGKTLSLTNRLRRFLSNEHVDVATWYEPLVRSFLQVYAGKQLRLVIDTTKVGFKHRMLVIGIAYRKRTLPLVWKVLQGTGGQVIVAEQIAICRRLRPLIPPESDVWLMGDSAFEDVPFMRWLRRQGWHFVIRQRGNVNVYKSGHGWRRINAIQLAPGQTRIIGWVRVTKKHNAGWYWLILHWEKGKEEPWYLLSDQSGERALVRLYEIRMWIEEMFGDMKGHGFDLEDTHLRDPERITRLILAVCITFVWFITLGTWVVKRGFRHLVDRKERRDKSYFRLGLDWLRSQQRLGQPTKLHFRPYL
jgi:hypothetical protein